MCEALSLPASLHLGQPGSRVWTWLSSMRVLTSEPQRPTRGAGPAPLPLQGLLEKGDVGSLCEWSRGGIRRAAPFLFSSLL